MIRTKTPPVTRALTSHRQSRPRFHQEPAPGAGDISSRSPQKNHGLPTQGSIRAPSSCPRSQGRQRSLGDHSVLVIIPAYQEERHLPTTLTHLVPCLPSHADLIVIDDGSRDGTAEAARRAGVACLQLSVHLGYGGALQTGYKYAWRHGYDVVVQLDADGQHDPSGIPALLATIEARSADLVIGSRFYAASTYRMPWVADCGRRFFSQALAALGGVVLQDPTSGFRAITRSTLAILIDDGFPMDYPDIDILLRLAYRGVRICEVPVVMHASPPHKGMHQGYFHPIRYAFSMAFAIFMTILRKIVGEPNVIT